MVLVGINGSINGYLYMIFWNSLYNILFCSWLVKFIFIFCRC